jgi:DNA-3-methyladenine glycosylase II
VAKTPEQVLAKLDPRLGELIKRVGPCRIVPEKMQSPFEALARAIVYQQLTGKAAATILGRVRDLFPRRRLHPDGILAASHETLRGAGLSRAKTAALKDLAEKTQMGVVPTLRVLQAMGDDEIVERLTEIRGIGRWTVEMLLIFRLGRQDVLPAGDYGVRKGFARLYKKRELPSERELLAYGERWRPYRAIASWYLWRAND